MTDETEAKPAETLPVESQPRRRGRRKEVQDSVQEPQPTDAQDAQKATGWLVKHGGKASADDMQVRISIVTITPETASNLLALARQRGQAVRYSKAAVATYAEAMRLPGGWVLNGMPIAISETQRILDGMQRLKACVDAGVPFVTFLVQNLPDDVEVAVDQQRKRSFAGVLESRGVANAGAIVTALTKLLRIQDGMLRVRGAQPVVSWATLERFYRPNADLLRQAAASALNNRYASTLLGDAARVPLAYMAARMNRMADLERMLADFFDPDRADERAPGYRLRERLETLYADTEAAGGRPNPVVTLALAVKAFDDVVTGKRTRGAYRWDVAKDAFPTPTGYPGLVPPIEAVGEVQIRQDAKAAVPKGVTMTYEVITPDMAREWLKHNSRNRNIQWSHVASLARDIRNGDWRLSPHAICWAVDKRSGQSVLVNGQHRLSACIEADTPIEAFIVRGLPDAELAFSTYDLQPRRAPSVGAPDEILDEELVLSIAQLYWRFRKAPELAKEWAAKHPDQAAKRGPGRLASWQKPSVSELRRLILSEQPGKAIREARFQARHLKDIARPAVAGYVALRLLETGPQEEAERFVRQLGGEGLEKGSVVMRLRKRLQDLRPKPGKPKDPEVDYNRFLPMYEVFETYEREVLGHKRPSEYIIPELVERVRRDAKKRKRPEAQMSLPGVQAMSDEEAARADEEVLETIGRAKPARRSRRRQDA